MKKIFLFLALFLSVCALFAEDEKISMIVGTTKNITVPFVIKSYKLVPSKTDIVNVEVAESHIRIMASAIGEVNLLVSGDGMSNNYTIAVKSNITQWLRKIREDLASAPEFDVAQSEDQIVVSGTTTNPEHWALLMKVLPNYSGKCSCMNYAAFKPSADTLKNLKKMLTDAGFVFCEQGRTPSTGELSLKISSDSVVLTGELYSQNDVDRINQILATQTWLSVNGRADASRGQIQGIVNLSVVETVLQVDIVYAAIQETDARKEGSNSDIAGNFSLRGLYDIIAGRGDGSAVIGGNMDATVRFLASNGVSRTYQAGHVSFTNNDPQGGTLHTGGTVYVKVNGVENGSLQNIQYGLKIKVTGGLVSPNRTKLTLDLTNSALLGTTGDSYNLSEDSTKQTVFCDLDKTIVIAGSKKIAEDTSNSGLPILRNTPVLKWFVSEDRNATTETRLLILACPRLVKADQVTISIPVSDQTAPTFEDSQKDNKTREEEKKPHRSWLNWFDW
jgi:Flp pilus assembly secretin CpaC